MSTCFIYITENYIRLGIADAKLFVPDRKAILAKIEAHQRDEEAQKQKRIEEHNKNLAQQVKILSDAIQTAATDKLPDKEENWESGFPYLGTIPKTFWYIELAYSITEEAFMTCKTAYNDHKTGIGLDFVDYDTNGNRKYDRKHEIDNFVIYFIG